MSKFYTSFLSLLLFVTIPAFSQITIGDGTSTQRFPFNYYYGYSRTASIYTTAEMNTASAGATITTISWYSTIASTVTGPTVIYLKQLGSTTAVASDTWANTITGATTVYTGTPASWTVGWNTIDITDYPIAANQNLEVLVECNYGSTGTGGTTGTSFQYTSGPANSNAWWQMDNTAPTGTPAASSSGAINSQRPNVLLAGLVPVACPTPTSLTIGSITTMSASVSFTSSGNSFILEYGAAGFVPGTGATAGTGGTIVSGTASPIVINGLTAATSYDVYIRQNCTGSGNGYSLNSSKATFTTSSNPPANDNASGAIALTVNPNYNCGTTTNGTTLGATQSPDAAPTCNATGINDDVWFTFTASSTAHRFVYSNVTTGTMATALYTGTPGNLTPVTGACLSGSTQDFTGLTGGTVYYARVYTTAATATTLTTFTVCIGTLPPPPANDNICGAIALSVSSGATCTTSLNGQSTLSATAGAAACAGSGADDDVWYSFIATNTVAIITLTDPATTPSGSSNDRVHQLYSSSDNTCTGTLTSLKCSDPETSTTTGLVVGNTYFVRVHSYGTGNYTTFGICITVPPPPPANDLPSGAIALTVDADCSAAPYTNAGANLTTNEPRISCKGSQTAGATVWFKFVAPASGFVRVSTDVTGNGLTDTKVGVFSATNPADLNTFQIIGCDDDNGSTLSAASIVYVPGLTPGQTYYVGVDHYNGASTGTFCVQVHNVTNAMIAPSGTCTSGQDLAAYLPDYKGWLSATNTNGLLVANIRSNATLSATTVTYTNALNVNTGAVRQDGVRKYYLDRNYRITNGGVAGNFDVQFFFLNTELTALQAVSPATTLANLNVTKVKGESACNANFVSGGAGNDSLLYQTASGSLGNVVNWVTVNTPGFSNFYLHSGTTPLPISLEYLKGIRIGTGNILNWKVNCTSVSITMELERSSDSRTFKAITSITATQARCGQPFDYTDASPQKGTNYYRLKIIDVDGKVTYSPIVAIINGTSGAELVGIYPTVVRDKAFVSVAASRSTKMQLNITDMSGRIIKTISETVANGSSLISINTANLSTGVYNITGMLDGVQTKTLRFVKQ